MERLVKEYTDLLVGEENASDKFWNLEERIKKDKKHPGVMLELSKGNIPYDEVNPFEETIDNVEEYDSDQGERIVNPSFITEEMATHFFSMFWGREDVYAKRGKNGGYFPQCDNRWDARLCPKQRGEKVFCDECENTKWTRLDVKKIIAHLLGYKDDGSDVIGVYPLLPNGMCRFIVFDFDNHEKGAEATASCFSTYYFRCMMYVEVENHMETKDVILELRNKAGLSQDELAEKVFVTRQAVSRWENGETTPNTETLKLLSKLFDVSINTLLGAPRQLICQCCGMPLEDSNISREIDGIFNEEYCKWCYADGEYMYHNMDDLIEVCVGHMANEQFTSDQARAYMKEMLPKLNYWKQYKNLDGAEKFEEFKHKLIDEINALNVEGMPKVEKLNALVGGYINLEYQLPNGKIVKFLDDNATYLGNQFACEFGGDRCFGIAANMDFILICTYETNGENPELVIYKKR